ncbi:hypothetical protein DIPPA_05242 [Diplonema papillatum]|nr:hypothetical protein DIPPA_28225 [Diplonema papillatum]KAJ9471463.1 hypothetical protein DIPPA_05242 [Diplonema papillatum]
MAAMSSWSIIGVSTTYSCSFSYATRASLNASSSFDNFANARTIDSLETPCGTSGPIAMSNHRAIWNRFTGSVAQNGTSVYVWM